MKAHIYVTLKRTVLDAQGKTVADALRRLGHPAVIDVRQGKYFVLDLAPNTSLGDAGQEIDQIAKTVLVNPVIEEYTFRLEP